MIEIEVDNIITDDDVDRGNFVLLGGRPGLEKIITIEKIIKKYHNKYDTLCFDQCVLFLPFLCHNSLQDGHLCSIT